MYIVKETIRFNNKTYLKNAKIDLTEDEANKISAFLVEVKGEKKDKVINENKEEIKSTKKSTKK